MHEIYKAALTLYNHKPRPVYCYATLCKEITADVAAVAKKAAVRNGCNNPAAISPCGGLASYGKWGLDCIAFIMACCMMKNPEIPTPLHHVDYGKGTKYDTSFMDVRASSALNWPGCKPLSQWDGTVPDGQVYVVVREGHIGLLFPRGQAPEGKDIIEMTPPQLTSSKVPGNSKGKPFTHFAPLPERWKNWRGLGANATWPRVAGAAKAAKAAKTAAKNAPETAVEKIARECIAGRWGNGEERRKRLAAAGYDCTKVQKRVNEILRKGGIK